MRSGAESFVDLITARRTIDAGVLGRYSNSYFAEHFPKIFQPASKLIPRRITNTFG
jgi:hypothetical protein